MSRCRAEMHNQVFVLSIILDKSCTLNVEHLYMCHSQNKKMKTDNKRPGMLAMCVMNEKSYHGWWYFFFYNQSRNRCWQQNTYTHKNKQKQTKIICSNFIVMLFFSPFKRRGYIAATPPWIHYICIPYKCQLWWGHRSTI